MMGTQSPETCGEKKQTYQEKLWTKLVLFTRKYRDPPSTKHKIKLIVAFRNFAKAPNNDGRYGGLGFNLNHSGQNSTEFCNAKILGSTSHYDLTTMAVDCSRNF
jgi:hypothetical protein